MSYLKRFFFVLFYCDVAIKLSFQTVQTNKQVKLEQDEN